MTDLTYQREELLVPPGTLRAWQGEQATTFRSVIANEFDNLAITTELVGKARNPLTCDATVLPYHGRDRRIRRYLTETEISYRLRLAKWRQIWGSAGRAWGILRQLRVYLSPFGRPQIRYVSTTGDGAESQWFTLAPGDGGNDYFQLGGTDPEFSRYLNILGNWKWDADASAGQYSRFWILIYTSGLATDVPQSTWDVDGEWDGPGTYWDGTFTDAQVSDMAQLCIDWSAAHGYLGGLFLVHDDTAFDPTGSGAGYPDGTWDLNANRRAGVTYSVVRT